MNNKQIDKITKLPTTNLFLKKINNKYKKSKMMIISIDDFNKLNFYYGEKIIKKIVLKISKKLKKYANNLNMEIYIIEKNKFLFINNFNLSINEYKKIIIKITKLQNFKLYIKSKKEFIIITTTIGISLENKNNFYKALIALKEAKKKEKSYIFYKNTMNTNNIFKERINSLNIIEKAFNNNNIIPYYQPIYDKNKNILKYEVLVRIKTDNNKILSPYQFLKILKEKKIYLEMTKRILKESFIIAKKYNIILSINLLARDMLDKDITNYILKHIKENNINSNIIFEILEDENIENSKEIQLFFKKLKKSNIKIAIDDFGTGYSNFSYFINFKPDYLKIDGSLIKNINNNNVKNIIKAIIVFAKTLNIKTIAEFIHSEKIFNECINLGIDEFQGFYLHKPEKLF